VKFHCCLIYVGVAWGLSAGFSEAANAQLNVKVEGCFREQASPNVTCRLSIKNTGHTDVATAFNSSNDRRVGGLDKFVSWAWDNLGRQYQIIDASIGGGRISRWRLAFTVPAGLQIPGEIVVANVAPDAKAFARMSLKFSPDLPIWRGLESFDFRNVSLE
jgi:hypothetical protein